MTGKSCQPPFTYSLHPKNTTAHNEYNLSYRSAQSKAPTPFSPAIVTPEAAPAVSWNLYRWESVAQQYYQQACQLKKEREAWKAYYAKLYHAHQETQKALQRAQMARYEAEKIARAVVALRLVGREG